MSRVRQTSGRPAVAALSWAVVIWALLSVPVTLTPVSPEGWELVLLPGSEKAVHALLFGIQAWLLHRVLRRRRRFVAGLVLAVAVSAGYGALTELYQGFLPHCSAELLDVVADAAGALAYGAWAWLRGGRDRRAGRDWPAGDEVHGEV